MAKDKDTDKKERQIVEVTDKIVLDVIDLARLDPLATGMTSQKEQLKNILNHFKILSEINIEGLDPTIQINPTSLQLRPDDVVDTFSREKALVNSRLRTDEFFRAPQILGGEEPEHV